MWSGLGKLSSPPRRPLLQGPLALLQAGDMMAETPLSNLFLKNVFTLPFITIAKLFRGSNKNTFVTWRGEGHHNMSSCIKGRQC